MTAPHSPTLDDLAALVPDGASVTVHKGDEPDVPMALAKALIRRGVRGLHVITLPTAAYPASGMLVDLLIGAGCIASVETSGISLHELGPAPRFSAAVKAGTLKVLDATCPAVYAALQAGAKGQPFAPLRGLIGSDLLRHRPDWKVIDNPVAAPGAGPDPIAVLPALNADVAIFHAAKADADGNVWVGRDRDRLLAAHAADTVLVTVDERVPGHFFADPALAAGTIPAALITALAVVPGGCWPMTLDGGCDLDAVRRYQQAARTDEGFADYLAGFVGTAVPA
ncbi:MAG TPA: CoA-transferase [Aquabacterium sp.]|nr:CoA-transferase [Aquabacterium sp.]HQC95765.1 CoA-transferase [Aquabacterium sp.]